MDFLVVLRVQLTGRARRRVRGERGDEFPLQVVFTDISIFIASVERVLE
jgi:hypothetical protein